MFMSITKQVLKMKKEQQQRRIADADTVKIGAGSKHGHKGGKKGKCC